MFCNALKVVRLLKFKKIIIRNFNKLCTVCKRDRHLDSLFHLSPKRLQVSSWNSNNALKYYFDTKQAFSHLTEHWDDNILHAMIAVRTYYSLLTVNFGPQVCLGSDFLRHNLNLMVL